MSVDVGSVIDVASNIIAAASIIAATVPIPNKYSKALLFLRKIVDFAALNFGNAKKPVPPVVPKDP